MARSSIPRQIRFLIRGCVTLAGCCYANAFCQVLCSQLQSQIQAEKALISEIAAGQVKLDITLASDRAQMKSDAELIAQLNSTIGQIQQQWQLSCSGIQQVPPPKTTPSDVFFDNAPDSGFVSGNGKTAYSIVAKDVTLRGWLRPQGNTSPDSAAVFLNEKVTSWWPLTVHLGYEDIHYEFYIDPDFIPLTYGFNNGVLNGAMLNGNPVDGETTALPAQDTWLDGSPLGIDFNSFWLPNWYTIPVYIHTEENAWHQRGSRFCSALMALLQFWNWCGFHEEYTPRGPAPTGWQEKEYTQPLPRSAADNWWPFDPDDPEPLGFSLKPGDYVEMRGTLWQDTAHDGGTSDTCWGRAFHSQDGWVEIHPIDSLRRLPSVPAPAAGGLSSGVAGATTTYPVTLCADPYAGSQQAWNLICPEATYTPDGGEWPQRTPTALIPHPQEIIDGRFTDPNLFGLSRSVTIGPQNQDCVSVQAKLLGGVTREYFKATYIVSWTAEPLPDAGMVTAVSPNVGPVAGGTLVSVQGVRFGSAPQVLFGPVAATPVSATASSLQVYSPAVSQPGTVPIQVMHDGIASLPALAPFTYCGPTINRLNPNTGVPTGGTQLTIIGSCFTGATSVQLGPETFATGTPQAQVNSDTEILAIAPAGKCGVPAPVAVTSPALNGTITSPPGTQAQFTYTDSACRSCLQACQEELNTCISGADHHGVTGCTNAWSNCKNACANK